MERERASSGPRLGLATAGLACSAPALLFLAAEMLRPRRGETEPLLAPLDSTSATVLIVMMFFALPLAGVVLGVLGARRSRWLGLLACALGALLLTLGVMFQTAP